MIAYPPSTAAKQRKASKNDPLIFADKIQPAIEPMFKFSVGPVPGWGSRPSVYRIPGILISPGVVPH
jgi:hypothetical protein